MEALFPSSQILCEELRSGFKILLHEQESKRALEKLARDEAARAEASKAKNELESYIISFSSRLSDDEGIAEVTTEQQRSEFVEQLLKAEDWLYSEGENAQLADVFL